MIALYLLAAHLVGDYLIQTRWQAADKLANPALRARHVCGYLVPFVVLLVYLRPSWGHAVAFVCLLAVVHYLTDSRRFVSTPGEWLVWQVRERRNPHRRVMASIPPNPWPPLPLFIDQTLHVCQLAVLGGILLT